MARRKPLRSQLYRAVRDLGKPRAVRDGGVKGLAKRDARRTARPKRLSRLFPQRDHAIGDWVSRRRR